MKELTKTQLFNLEFKWSDIANNVPDRLKKRYKNKKYWEEICFNNKNLPEDFIREYKEYVNWNFISDSSFHKLSDDFIREFKDYYNWKCIKNRPSSKEFLIKFKDYIDWNELIFYYKQLPENFIRIILNYITNWKTLSTYQTLSENFIREYKDKVDWNAIVNYQILSKDFIEEMKSEGYIKDEYL